MSAGTTSPHVHRSMVGIVLVGVLVAACGSKAAHSAPSPSALRSTSTPIASASAAGSSAAGSSTAGTSPAAPIASASAVPSRSSSAAASWVGVPAGQVGTRAQIPWDQVGPGWFLVQSDSSAPSQQSSSASPAPKGGTATLALVSPDGARYVIMTWPGRGAGSGPMNLAELVAWSGDGHHALFNNFNFGNGIATEMDLTTAVSRQISVPNLFTIGFTSPKGANLVAVEDIETADGTWMGQQLVRLDLNGKMQVQLAKFDRAMPHWLYSRDGATVYLNGSGGLGVVSNAGGPIRVLAKLQTPGADCAPVTWWDQRTILANCSDTGGSRLWLVQAASGSATPLTAVPGKDPVGAGYDNAVRVGGAVFAEHLEGCGVVTVHRLAPSGLGTRIAIPQSLSNDHLVGAVGGKIAIASSTECGAPSWFGFYDPATNTTQKIVPDVPGELGVQAALAFP